MSTEKDWMERVPQLKGYKLKWDTYFLRMALLNSSMSRDPDTRVGAVIVGPDREVRSTGFNGFPRGIYDDPELLKDRDRKLSLMVHAEMNALMNAARIGVSTKGCTLYLAATDDSGKVWGGPPCQRCTVHTIQAGIIRVVAPPQKSVTKWEADLEQARRLLTQASIDMVEIPIPW